MPTGSPRAELPALPTPRAWVRPSRCRPPSLECIAAAWGPVGRLVATAGRLSGTSWTVPGVLRPLRGAQCYREFTSYSTARRYLAAWVAKYTDELATELGTPLSQHRD